MMDDLSADTVRRFGDRLRIDLSPSEAERLAAGLSDALDSYTQLDRLTRNRPSAAPPMDVVFDPGPDADPLNAFVSRFTLSADEPAVADGPDLADLSVGVKDNVAIGGVPTTCGSRVFQSAVPGRHATVVDRLVAAGATITGKTNMDELAYGPTSETSGFGPVRNPVDDGHVAGGSSSGSAAAVGDDTVDAALGTDTGGSVRIPASFCGVVGFKPSWGMVPRTGVVELSFSLDHVGPIARDVTTATRVFDAIAGVDPADPSSERARRLEGTATDAVAAPPSLDDVTLGLPEELFGAHVDDDVRAVVDESVAALEAAGVTTESVSVPRVTDSVAVWNAITNVEFASTLRADMGPIRRRGGVDPVWQENAAAALHAHVDRLGPVAVRKAILGAYLRTNRPQTYITARVARSRLAAQFDDVLAGCDALVAPTMPVTAPELGEWTAERYSTGGSDYDVPLAFNTRPADLADLPALSLPCGRTGRLPVGLQLVGERYADHALLALGRAVESVVTP